MLKIQHGDLGIMIMQVLPGIASILSTLGAVIALALFWANAAKRSVPKEQR